MGKPAPPSHPTPAQESLGPRFLLKGLLPLGVELLLACPGFTSAFPTKGNPKSSEQNQGFQGPFQLRREGGDQPLHSPGEKQQEPPGFPH